ncbi:Hpt domain-containing protein [Ancylobacter terrae]|uniref:Hpt domain-containing protein n=1 Tax=Ancylobacter sp. sgz301288 TaxID=3342077 RepID=UPI003859E354
MSRKDTLTIDFAQVVLGCADPGAPVTLDRSQLERSTGGDVQLSREVLGIFLAHADRVVGEMGTARTADDARIAVHGLRGAALAVGAVEVACTAAALESALAGGTADARLAADFTAAVAAAKSAMAAWLAEPW